MEQLKKEKKETKVNNAKKDVRKGFEIDDSYVFDSAVATIQYSISSIW